MNRRSFLKSTAAVGAGAWALPSFSIGQEGPSAGQKLNLAVVGAGHMGSHAVNACKPENMVAICDVDSSMFQHAAENYPGFDKVAQFSDFRVMLDTVGKDLDGVLISTPDHTHFAATLAAMERGLHVFTQKPLTHNIWQARTLRRAMHKYGVITNMGNQGHAYDGIRQMREWVEADVFGQIREAHSFTIGPRWGSTAFQKPSSFPPPEDPVPAELDYDLWLGPAEATPFNQHYHPRRWRGFNQFGSGTMGDWFCHIADGPVWILDLYEPTVIEAEEVKGGNEWICPDALRVRYDFAQRGTKAPCSFYWHNGPPSSVPGKPERWDWGNRLHPGTLYYGDKTDGYTDERSNNPRMWSRAEMKAFKESGYPEEVYPRLKEKNPFSEWIMAIKGEGPEPGSNFDYGARLTEVGHLGVLAARFGGRIEWDAKNMRITNRPELNAYLKEPARKGWEYGEDLWKG